MRREARFWLVAPVAALAAYLPAIVVPYAYMDDYYVLAWREGLAGNFFKTATSFGRPLHAVLLSGTFAFATDIDSLRLVRLVSLLGVMLLAVLLYYALRQADVGPWLATGICVSVVTLASMQIYVAWASIGEAPFVAALGGLAYLRLRASPGRRGWIESGVLLLLALLAYQPAAMFFWVFAAIDTLRPGQRLGAAARRFGVAVGVAGVAMFLAYVAVRIGVHFYGGATAGRTHLVHDIVGKARWFWDQPLVNSFALFGLVPSVSLAVALAIVVAVGIVLLHAETGRDAFGFLGLAACLVPLSYLPNLAVAEEFASYRSIGALATLVALYVWFALWGIARSGRVAALALAAPLSFIALALVVLPLARPATRVTLETLSGGRELIVFVALVFVFAAVAVWRWSAVALALGVLAVGAGVVIAARNVTTLVVKPQRTELQLLRSELDGQRQRVVFVKPSPDQSPAPLVRYDEFGLPSTYFAWVPEPAVALLSRERSQDVPKLEVLASDQAPSNPDVDMRKLDATNVDWSVWTLTTSARRR